jgi:hypothetical protein
MQTRNWLVRSSLVLSILGAAGLVASLPASAQNPAPSTGAAPAATGDDNAAEFVKLDKNHDGFLDKGEAIMEPKLLGKWADADTNKDGKVSKEEFLAFEKKEHPKK